MTNNSSKWIQRIQEIDIPVMQRSRDFIAQHQDSPGITISRIQKHIQYDPGLTLRFLIEAGTSKSTHVTNLSHAMLMLGMPRVLSYTRKTPVLEETVSGEVLNLIRTIYHRHYFLARLARRWAEQRSESEWEDIFTAALVRNASEWLLCLSDPALARAAYKKSRQSGIHYSDALEQSLDTPLERLSLDLAKHWNLPERVAMSLSKEKTEQCVWIEQASEIAACAEAGWFIQAAQKQLNTSANLLRKKDAAFIQDVHQCCVASSRDSYPVYTPAIALATELVRLPGPKYEPQRKPLSQTATTHPASPKTPKEVLKHALSEINNNQSLGYQELISHCFKALDQGLGLDRVMLTLLTPDKKSMKVRFSNTPDELKAPLKQLTISLGNNNLFQRIISKPALVWSRDENRSKYTKLLPDDFYRILKSRHFFMISLFVDHKPIGVIYADRQQGDTLDLQHHKYFKHVCQSLETALQRLSDRNHKKRAG